MYNTVCHKIISLVYTYKSMTLTQMKKYFWIAVLLIQLPLLVDAQETCVTTSRKPYEWPSNNTWFVGQFSGSLTGGAQIITFNGGFSKTPATQPIAVYEGVTAISDDNGDMVLISNGKYAWDASGAITSTDIKEGDEAGGQDPTTSGAKQIGSASQGIISVRHPLTPNKYYIVTVGDVIGGASPGMTYNMFDENGVETQGNTPLGVDACEGIAATLHENGVDVWVTVLEYGAPNLYSYLLTCDGFVDPPVISTNGDIRTGDAGRGGLAFSHDGTQFVASFPTGWPNAAKQVALYNFDKKTGEFKARQNIGPTNFVLGPYDVIFSKDNSEIIVAKGNGGTVNSINIATKALTQNLGAIGGSSHTVEIGGDGNYYFNGGDGLWQWSGSGNATKVDDATGWGLPTIYIPPAEEPDIQEPGVFCDTSAAIDLHTNWLCSGVSAEDTLYQRHEYTGIGITDSKIGTFSPIAAGVGSHEIIFTYCDVNDTILIEVTECATCIDTLQNIRPEICAGQTVNLTALVDTSNGPGIWSIASYPNSLSVNPTIDDSAADTLFDATDMNSKPGIYKLMFTVTKSSKTCRDSLNIRVNSSPIIAVNDSVICAGGPQAEFTANADSSVFSYAWSDNGTAALQTTSGNTAGDYTVTVTDNNGCVGTATGVLTINALPVVSVNDSTICFGNPDALFTAISDSAVQSYAWSDNGTDALQTTSGSIAGIYTVDIIDENGCAGNASGELVVNVLPVVSVNDDTICLGGSPGIFTVTSDTTIQDYLWSDNGNGTNNSYSDVTPGKYSVFVVDKNGCEGTAFGTLKVNTPPVISVNDSTICDGDPNALFTAVSDSAVQFYAWSQNGSGVAQTASGSQAGDYIVIVTDVNGCEGTATGTLTVNALPIVSVNDSSMCESVGDVVFTATVDSVVDSYSWSGNGSGNLQTTNGSTAGDYIVTIEDENGCIGTGTGVLKINKLPVVSVNDNEICDGGNPAVFSVTSDSLVDTYAWSDQGSGATPTNSGTTAGDYTVQIIDVNGCEGSAKGVLTVHDLPVAILNGGNVCPNTPFTLDPQVTTLNTPVTYLWDSGEQTATVQKGQGTYSVTMTDAKQCVTTASATVVEDPNLTVVIPGPVDLCAGESANLISNFKTADGYIFNWTTQGGSVGTTENISVNTTGIFQVDVNKGNCTGTATVDVTVHDLPIVTVNDASICSGDADATFTATSTTAIEYLWSEEGTGENPTTTGSTAGNYTVLVKDNNDCEANATGVLTVNDLPTVTVNSETICADAPNATFTATSPTATSYIWDANGTGTQNTTSGNTEGDYTVEVTDNNSCKMTGTGSLTVKALPVVSVNSETICEGDNAATFTVTSDTTITSYSWSDQGSGASPTNSGTTAGNYIVEIVDNNGCLGTATGILTVEALPIVGNDPASICEGDAATIGENVAGGTYSYAWSGINETTATIQVNNGGNYTRTVTSTANCVNTSSYVVTENLKPTIQINDDEQCDGALMTLFDQAQNTGYTYSWMPGNHTTNSINPTQNETYTITKTNSNTGCIQTDEATATFIPIPNVNIEPDTVPICQGQTAELLAKHDATSILWTTGSITDEATANQEGYVYVRVSNGECPARDSVYVKVTQYPVSELDKTIEETPICFEELESIIQLTANSSRDYSYIWGTGEITPSIDALTEGTYVVTISDNNCSISDHVTINDFCPWTLYVPNSFSPNNDGTNDYFYANGYNIQDFKMLVYDRWGMKIFESDDLNTPWDGTYLGNSVQIDVYVYKIYYSVENIDGNMEKETKVGTVTILK